MQEVMQDAMQTVTSSSINTHSVFAEQENAQLKQRRWHVLWTRSNCETIVNDQLSTKGFDAFLPKISQWFEHKGRRYLTRTPMFPGYLFLHHAMDRYSYIDVCKTKGLVRILGERWDRLGTVPEQEIKIIQKVVQADVPVRAQPYLREGQRVSVISGPLANAEGILVKYEPNKGLLVLSIELMKRSIGVQIDCTLVRPV